MYLILKVLLIYWVSSAYMPEDSNMTVRTLNLMCVIVLITLLEFSRITPCFELWVKWYFRLQDPVHIYIESRNIHIQTKVYSFISDPPKDALQKHENVHAH